MGWDAPAVQLAQVLAPAPEYCPAAQFTQAKNIPEILECLPEAQLWHAVLASPSIGVVRQFLARRTMSARRTMGMRVARVR